MILALKFGFFIKSPHMRMNFNIVDAPSHLWQQKNESSHPMNSEALGSRDLCVFPAPPLHSQSFENSFLTLAFRDGLGHLNCLIQISFCQIKVDYRLKDFVVFSLLDKLYS